LDGYSDFFLSGLQKLGKRTKKCIELHGEVVESIPSFVSVAFFFPGRANDISAPLRIKVLKLAGECVTGKILSIQERTKFVIVGIEGRRLKMNRFISECSVIDVQTK
jgi:hypothetical protein